MKIKLTALQDVSVFASYSVPGSVQTSLGDTLPAPVPKFGWLSMRAGESCIIAVFWGINPRQLPGEPTIEVAPNQRVVAVQYDPETEKVREFHGLLRMEPVDV